MLKVELHSAGVDALLSSPGVHADLNRRGELVKEAARDAAPFESGAYQESIERWPSETDRAVCWVGSELPYAYEVEAATGNLARALDAGLGPS